MINIQIFMAENVEGAFGERKKLEDPTNQDGRLT